MWRDLGAKEHHRTCVNCGINIPMAGHKTCRTCFSRGDQTSQWIPAHRQYLSEISRERFMMQKPWGGR